MKHLNLNAYEPGEMIGTVSKDGKVALWTVASDGSLTVSDNRIFVSGISTDDPIDELNLSVRAYNVLKRESISTVGQMIAVYDTRGINGFRDMRNMGEKSVDEIVNHILRLRGEDPLPAPDADYEPAPLGGPSA